MSFATAQSRIEVEAKYIASTGIPYYQAVQIARENEAKRNAKRLADAQKKREEQSARRATVAEKQQEPRKEDLNKEIQKQQEEYAKALEERNRLNREREEASLDINIANLSFGQQKKISLLRLFLNNSDLLILDEPCVGLDIKTQEILVDFLKKELVSGKAIIYSSHILLDFDSDSLSI